MYCAVALSKLLTCTPMCLCNHAVQLGTGQRAVMLWGWEGDRRSGDALAMCHRLCGLSTYGLKAHVRTMSTPPKFAFWHSTSSPVWS